MPKRFGLEYADKDGQKKTPVMIHRAILGSYERFLALLIEHYAGAFPTWLSPVQVKILSVSEKHATYAKEVADALRAADVRVELDDSNESLGKKIREGKTSKTPYLLVVGDKEMDAKTVSVESRDHGKQDAVPMTEFVARVAEEVRTRA